MSKVLARVIDYKKVFNTPEGQRVLYDLMREFHMLRPTYYSSDPQAIYMNEGGRNAVLYILDKLKVDVRKLKARIDEEVRNEQRESS